MMHFASGRTDDANALVVAHHYSRRPPANVQVVGTWHLDGGLFGDRGEAVAACFLSLPPTRWSEPVLELSRLVRIPDVSASLSRLIALTCSHARAVRAGDMVVSFADWTQGHHGGVYQAAGWSYAGRRERSMDGVILDGVFLPGRSCNSRWGTRSPAKLARIIGRHVEPHYDEGKHLYWKAFNRHGRAQAARLGLPSLPYPKPAISPEDAPATSGCEAGATPADRSNQRIAA